jgi:hypothetical protein
MRKAFITVALLMITAFVAGAQEAQPEMADALRSNGKIYVVVTVLATIFAGIIVFLVRLDRKMTRLEQNK